MPVVRVAILAAGQASRFGSNKLMQPWRGRSLLSHVLDAAKQACPNPVLVVTGSDAEAINPICAEFAAETVFNPDYANGIGTSIATAARVCEGNADAMLLMLGDQPLVTGAHLRDLVDHWQGDRQRICASGFANTLGPPVLFGSAYFAQLARLTGDGGARELIRNSDRVVAVDFEPAAIDVDLLADMSELDKFLADSE